MEFPNLIEAGLKVGDEVDTVYGTGVVTKIHTGYPYPVYVKVKERTCTFASDGKRNKEYHKYPSLWFKSDMSWFKPPTKPPEPDHMKEFTLGRKVWVRFCGGLWDPRIALAYLPSAERKFCAFADGADQETAKDAFCWDEVSYTKPKGAQDHE